MLSLGFMESNDKRDGKVKLHSVLSHIFSLMSCTGKIIYISNLSVHLALSRLSLPSFVFLKFV